MRLIDADTVAHWQTYDDEHETFPEHEGTIAEFLDSMTDEGCPGVVDAVPVVRCAVCIHFQCNMRGDGTLPKGVDEFECRNGRGGCDPMGFCDEGERKDGNDD